MSLIVIIVDDDDAVRFFHRLIVSQSGLAAEPLSFGSAMETLNYLDENSDETNTYLILLDINMPVMDGWDLLNALGNKSYYKQVYVVMATSSVNKADKEKAKLYSMVIDFVEKPILDEVCKRIMLLHPIDQYF